MGKRGTRKNLGIAIPHEILYKKARLPATSNGITGISPRLEKLCLKETKTRGITPARITSIINGHSLKLFSVCFGIWRFKNHRNNNAPLTIVIPIKIFSPR